VYADSCGIGNRLAERLEEQGQDVTIVTRGEAFRRVRDGVYTINPEIRDDYDALLKHLHLINQAPQRIIHLWSVTRSDTAYTSARKLSVPTVYGGGHPCGRLEIDGHLPASQFSGFHSLLFLAQALGNGEVGPGIPR